MQDWQQTKLRKDTREGEDCDDIFDNPVLAAFFADDTVEDDNSGESKKKLNKDAMKHM